MGSVQTQKVNSWTVFKGLDAAPSAQRQPALLCRQRVDMSQGRHSTNERCRYALGGLPQWTGHAQRAHGEGYTFKPRVPSIIVREWPVAPRGFFVHLLSSTRQLRPCVLHHNPGQSLQLTEGRGFQSACPSNEARGLSNRKATRP